MTDPDGKSSRRAGLRAAGTGSWHRTTERNSTTEGGQERAQREMNTESPEGWWLERDANVEFKAVPDLAAFREV